MKKFNKIIIGVIIFICYIFICNISVYAGEYYTKSEDGLGEHTGTIEYDDEKKVIRVKYSIGFVSYSKYVNAKLLCKADSLGEAKVYNMVIDSISNNERNMEAHYYIGDWPTLISDNPPRHQYQCKLRTIIYYSYDETKTQYINDEGNWINFNHIQAQSKNTINKNKYVFNAKETNFSCGTELYITSCSGDGDDNKECEYTKVNGKEKTGKILAKYLKSDKDLAKSACISNPADKPATPLTPTRYTITLIAKGTKKFQCPSNYGLYTKSTSTDVDGRCEGTLTKGSTFVLPEIKEANYKGWSTSEDCKSPIKTATVSGKATYYACYGDANNSNGYKVVNGLRYLKEGAVSGVPCGSQYYITYCPNNDICYGCANKDNCSSPVTINRSNLAEKNTTICNVSTSNKENVNKDMYATTNGDNFKCGDKLYVTICTDIKCSYSKVEDVASGGTIDKDALKDKESDANAVCDSNELDENDKKCPKMKVEYDNTSEGSYPLCYDEDLPKDEIIDKLESLYKCESGYYFDKTYVVLEDGKEDNCNDYICNENYAVRCKKESSGIKPIIDIGVGSVGSNNIGVVEAEAKAFEGEINAYYVSEYYTTPTLSDDGWIEISSPRFTIEGTPGTLYVWVRDTEGNISNNVRAVIRDNNNSKNTLQKIEIHDANGKIQTPSTVSFDSTGINSNKYVMMSNDLRNDSKVLADAFNPYNMEYKVEVNSPTLSVYATLTSTDAKYVAGYEPRTVNLKYGTNTILIKIQDNEGKVRTYTILATRIDDRTSDNTLSDLKVSVGEIEFNANVTDYKIEIPANTKTVDVTSVIASNVASYVKGYEPGTVNVTGNTTVKFIKVISQTGSTRTYVLTFVKKNTDVITDKTLQLKDLVVPGVYVPFESEVANYSFSVGYEMDSIDIKPILRDSESTYTFYRKRKNEIDYKEGSNIGVPLDVGENFIEIKVQNTKGDTSYYRVTVIRKEFGLGISNDTTLKDLRVLNYDIKFEPNKKDYTVKIKQEKTLVITAVPASNRSEVFIRGNDELTGFSTVRVKVIAENGEFETYSIDIKKDAFNMKIEIAALIAASVIILGTGCMIIIKKKSKSNKEYYNE